MTSDITKIHLHDNIQKHKEYFKERKGNLLLFGEECASITTDNKFNYHIEGETNILSKKFLIEKAYELGIKAVKRAESAAIYHAYLGDDWHPYINVDWGTGFTASLFTGGDVIFERNTSYSVEPFIKDWDDLGKVNFDLDNQWIACLRDFWRGVEAAYEIEEIAVTPYMYRSPLDLANDLRGNEIFYDMYDYPKEVEALINYCAECIIKLDNHLRNEFPILKKRPGGVWGAVFDDETIFLNGDPVDLISDDMGKRFNNSYVEKIANYTGNLFFHHHSIGYSRAKTVSNIKGLAVQEILQDPNGPRLVDIIDNELIKASQITPIYLDVNLLVYDNYEEILEQLSEGRFIVSVKPNDLEQGKRLFENLRKLFH